MPHAEITNLLKDMNTLTPDIHSQSDCEDLIKAIENRVYKNKVRRRGLIPIFRENATQFHTPTPLKKELSQI